MPAYLLLLVAVLSRLLPHGGWMNFTAVGGALLYFGARRSWREMLAPLAVLMAADYFLTIYVYHYDFHWLAYLPTWAWYVAAMALGQILLRSRTTFVRAGAATLLGPTSFFLLLELCGLGGRRHVSAHVERAGHMLRGRVALLSQRCGFDGDCCREWRSECRCWCGGILRGGNRRLWRGSRFPFIRIKCRGLAPLRGDGESAS